MWAFQDSLHCNQCSVITKKSFLTSCRSLVLVHRCLGVFKRAARFSQNGRLLNRRRRTVILLRWVDGPHLSHLTAMRHMNCWWLQISRHFESASLVNDWTQEMAFCRARRRTACVLFVRTRDFSRYLLPNNVRVSLDTTLGWWRRRKLCEFCSLQQRGVFGRWGSWRNCQRLTGGGVRMLNAIAGGWLTMTRRWTVSSTGWWRCVVSATMSGHGWRCCHSPALSLTVGWILELHLNHCLSRAGCLSTLWSCTISLIITRA